MDTERLIELVRRAPVFEALREEGAIDRRDLEQHLDVSKSTVHRFTRSLRDDDLLERSDDGFTLTALGKELAETVGEFERRAEIVQHVAPVLEAVRDHHIDFPLAAFADATVTTAGPGNPYRAVERFMLLVEETERLRGLDPASINPLHVEEIHRRILNGMATEAVFPSGVVEQLLNANPKRMKTAFESANLTILTYDDLPFGLTLCDDRIGIGNYDETGMLRTYVDTKSLAAREWGEGVYTDYRAEATLLTEHTELSRLPPVRALGSDR